LLCLGAGTVGALSYLRASERPSNDPQTTLGVRVAELEVIVRGLPSLWEEERERAKKHSNSAKAANRDAERKLEEVAELVASGVEAFGGDEAGSDPVGMQPVSTRLGDPTAPDRRQRVEAVAHLMR